MTADHSLEDWLAYIQTVHFRSIDMTLDRVSAVLERLGVPSFEVLAVAGTNGKGSCAAMLGSILAARDRRTGVYTSPHLVRFNERIEIDGEPAADEDLCRAFDHVESLRGDIPLTYFEFATLAAVHLFQRYGVDVAVMEVGMGGRLDAVNALSIDASLVTNVELDHMHWLGPDREAIGREKAHIMRPARTTVYNHADPPRSVLEHAARIDTRLLLAGRDYRHEPADNGWRWHGPRGESWALQAPPIPGAVQVENAAGALALLSGWGGVELDSETAARGLAGTRVHARCEILAHRPLVIVDVAHNLSAVDTLKAHMRAHPVAGRTTAVFGMLKDKDPAGAVRALDGVIDHWCLAGIDDERGQGAGELAESMAHLVSGPVHCHDDAVKALECALEHSGPDDRVVGFGSFHIAGDILARMTRPS